MLLSYFYHPSYYQRRRQVPPSVRKKRTKLVGPPNNIIELDHIHSTQIHEPEVVDVDAASPLDVSETALIEETITAHDGLTFRFSQLWVDGKLVKPELHTPEDE